MIQLYLSGFMGAGKSTVGKVLSSLAKIPLIDLDDYICKKTRQTIPDIFQEQGESGFRQLELSCLREIQTSAVIALGGGAIVTPEVRDHIRRNGFSVFLEWPIEVLLDRVCGDANRPLAKDPEAMRKLYQSRLPWYREASLVWRSKAPFEETPNMIAQTIMTHLKKDGFLELK